MKRITHEEVKLLHAEYDPVKAHEYYLQNRELKGRQPAAVKPTPVGRLTSTRTPAPAKKSGAQYARQPLLTGKKTMDLSQAKARVASIQKRLGALQNVLASLKKQKAAESAKKKSTTKKKSTSTASKTEPKRQLTAKQKADNKERSKKYYEEHKEPAKPKAKSKSSDLDAKIALVEDQIKKTKVELAVAKVKAGIK